MSYRYNPRVSQKLSYAHFFQDQIDSVDSVHLDSINVLATEEAVVFELVNVLSAFLNEIADNYGLNFNGTDVDRLSQELKQRDIVSAEVAEILLLVSSNGWLSGLLTQHGINCAGGSQASSNDTAQPLRFVEPTTSSGRSSVGSRYWLSQLSELIDRHREGLVEW